MRVVVGLGNPGPEYAATRHNAGFRLADALAERWEFGGFRRLGRARVADGRLDDGTALIVLKPQTYMNRSGQALTELLADPEFDASEDLLVVSDEAMLPLGRYRLRRQGSAGGHNGLKSVQGAVGSLVYPRLRIGVGPVPEGLDDLSDFVLAPFPDEELRMLDALLPELTDVVDCWAREGVETAMNRFNQPRTTD